MKINKQLEEIIKKIDGSLLGIGIEDKKLINLIDKNNKITECNLLNCYVPDTTDTLETINSKKIPKKFKKKSTNNIICNLQTIDKIKEEFVYDSIYIGNDKIYVYTTLEREETIRRYKRYCKINITKCSDGFIYELTINKKITKINKFYYKKLDKIIDIIEIISNLLSDS